MSPIRKALAAAATTLAVIAGALTLAAPAHAADLSLSGPTSSAPGAQVQYTVRPVQVGTVVLLDQNGTQWAQAPIGFGAGTTATLSFQVPSGGSPLQLTATNYDENYSPIASSNTITLSFASNVGTTTQIQAPNVAKVGTATKILVNVYSQSGSTYSPTGNVVFTDGSGNVVSTVGLSPNGAGKSYAYWWWTPKAAGSYIFVASYKGDGVSQPSQSAQDVVFASASGSNISLTAPGTMTAGIPVTLVATLVPSTIQGSVGFTYNGKPISASIPIVNGQASFQWIPTTPGQAVIGANFTTNGGASGSTSDNVTIVAGPTAQDVITLTQPGYGAWAPGGTYPLGNGSVVGFTATDLSGAPVALSVTGPCAVNGMTLTVNAAAGACVLTAKTSGGGNYGPATYTYNVAIGPGVQQLVSPPPPSGKLAKKRTYQLSAPGVDTNAGQNVTWKVIKGPSVCKIGYPASGAVTIKLVKSGSCSVRGIAPGVPNMWQPLTVDRTYKS